MTDCIFALLLWTIHFLLRNNFHKKYKKIIFAKTINLRLLFILAPERCEWHRLYPWVYVLDVAHLARYNSTLGHWLQPSRNTIFVLDSKFERCDLEYLWGTQEYILVLTTISLRYRGIYFNLQNFRYWDIRQTWQVKYHGFVYPKIR